MTEHVSLAGFLARVEAEARQLDAIEMADEAAVWHKWFTAVPVDNLPFDKAEPGSQNLSAEDRFHLWATLSGIQDGVAKALGYLGDDVRAVDT